MKKSKEDLKKENNKKKDIVSEIENASNNTNKIEKLTKSVKYLMARVAELESFINDLKE